MRRPPDSKRGRQNEEGALLIVIMIGVAVASIALGAAVQAWSTTWRRDNEEELIFRGRQYMNAILLYRKEHGGQFPLNLEDLAKQGPRRLRYIRKLFKDPIAKDGKWGLLYLAPGGQQVYDPKAAQRAAKNNGMSGDADDDDGQTRPGGASGTGFPPGSQPPGGGAFGGGLGGGGITGVVPGGQPQGGLQVNLQSPPIGTGTGSSSDDEKRVSEPPLGWPIVGVISRAEGAQADKTFATYKGHEKVDEWQFNALEVDGQQPLTPGNPMNPRGIGGVGPGYGGKPGFGGITGGDGPRPGRGGFGGGWGGGGAGTGNAPANSNQYDKPDNGGR